MLWYRTRQEQPSVAISHWPNFGFVGILYATRVRQKTSVNWDRWAIIFLSFCALLICSKDNAPANYPRPDSKRGFYYIFSVVIQILSHESTTCDQFLQKGKSYWIGFYGVVYFRRRNLQARVGFRIQMAAFSYRNLFWSGGRWEFWVNSIFETFFTLTSAKLVGVRWKFCRTLCFETQCLFTVFSPRHP